MKNLPARTPAGPPDPLVARTQQGPPRVDEKSIDLGSVWNVIRNGKWLILTVLFLATAFAILYSFLAEPTYEATSIVSVNTRGSLLPGADVITVKGPVVSDEIGLLERSGELAVRVAESLVENSRSIGITAIYPLVEENESNGDNIVNAISGELWRHMHYRDLGSGMISITAQSSSSYEAAKLANLFASEYEALNKERSRASIVAAREFLEEQFEQRADELAKIRLEYARVQTRNNVLRQGSSGERAQAEYSGIQDRLTQAEAELRRYELEAGSIRSELDATSENIATNSSAALQLQLDDVNRQIADHESQLATAYRNRPELRDDPSLNSFVKQLVDELNEFVATRNDLQKKLLAENQSSGGADFSSTSQSRLRELDIQIAERRQAIQRYQSELERVGSELDEIPFQRFEVDQVGRKLSSAESWFQSLQTELQNYKIAEQAELGYVDIIKKAGTPGRPVKPDLQMNVMLALLLGLAGGLGLAFVRTAVRTKLDAPDDVAGLGYPLLGSVPLLNKEIKTTFKGRDQIELNGKKRSTALVTLHSPWSPASEHYRLIRTNLQLGVDGSMPQVLMVTSPEPGDGKSVTALNLAISIAHSGGKTLVIDADLRRATLHKLLDSRVSPGLAELLSSRTDAVGEMEAFKTDIESLYFLPAGKALVPPPELLGSPRMKRLIEHLGHSFDTIIIDTPPVLAVTDALIMSPCCDAAVLVVSANKTTPKAINASISALENVRISIAGIVFNRHNTERNRTGYYDYSSDYSYAIEDN
ncbi:MAG: polysaccharide biosynthesis tyrosine autokinase [Rhodothermales bacterium]